jgi:hypothetical protein
MMAMAHAYTYTYTERSAERERERDEKGRDSEPAPAASDTPTVARQRLARLTKEEKAAHDQEYKQVPCLPHVETRRDEALTGAWQT